MREIKFRAFLKTGVMQYGVVPFQWDYVIDTMWHKCIESNGIGILGSGGTEAKFEVGDFAFEHLMQFTGLKDKNGKDIYEGDIIKQVYYPLNSNSEIIEYYKIGIIIYTESYFGIQLKFEGSNILDESRKMYHHRTYKKIYIHPTQGKDWIDRYIRIEGIEIIGNIHENPELLTNHLN